MCSISGAFAIGRFNYVDKGIVETVSENSLERGRDAIGRYDGWYVERRVGRNVGIPLMMRETDIVMQNNRAEPTTEWLPDVTEQDIQPYVRDEEGRGRFVWTHNGTIANDKQLARTLGVEEPRVDSMIIGPALVRGLDGRELTPGNIVERLGLLVGSYAIAAFDEHKSTLYLAANYKPIYTAVVKDVLYWASLPHHLPEYGKPWSTVQKLSPYTVMVVRAARPGVPPEFSFLPIPAGDGNTNVLVVASGGMDSTVVAAQQVALGHKVSLLHVLYGARAETPELEAVERIAHRLGVDLITVETDLFKNTIKASRLTETHTEIAEGEAGAELAIEWVPARNLILASIAVGIAEARNFGTIALGNNLEESGAYPDNEQEFIHRLNDVMPNAVNVNRSVRFVQPVGNMMKHEIVKLGLDVNAPLDLTWSCYNGRELQCGHCGPCYMRQTAFRMNGVTDPITYEEPLA